MIVIVKDFVALIVLQFSYSEKLSLECLTSVLEAAFVRGVDTRDLLPSP